MQGTLLRRHPPIQSLSQGWTRADQRRSCCACALARQAPELAARMLRQSSLSRSLHVCLLALVHAHGPAAMKTLQPLSIALEARPSNCFHVHLTQVHLVPSWQSVCARLKEQGGLISSERAWEYLVNQR